MTESKHTPEPWALSSIGLPSDIPVKGSYVYPLGTDGDKAVANAARIVECVNACAGMDDPQHRIHDLKMCEFALKDTRAELATLRELAKVAQQSAGVRDGRCVGCNMAVDTPDTVSCTCLMDSDPVAWEVQTALRAALVKLEEA